jgi:hypothetical protein
MQVVDSSGNVLGTGFPFPLNDGTGSYFVSLDADFPADSSPADCVLIWLAPPSTGEDKQLVGREWEGLADQSQPSGALEYFQDRTA